MSNVKKIIIETELDYNFALKDEELATEIGKLLCMGSMQMKLPYPIEKYPNEYGGQMTVVRYYFTIHESLRWVYLERLANMFRRNIHKPDIHRFSMISIDIESGQNEEVKF